MSDAHHDFDGLTRDEALAELARRGVRGPEVYLLDVLPLVEMAWSDGTVQDAERVLIEAFLDEHVGALHREAGVTVIGRAEALRFVQRVPQPAPRGAPWSPGHGLLRCREAHFADSTGLGSAGGLPKSSRARLSSRSFTSTDGATADTF